MSLRGAQQLQSTTDGGKSWTVVNELQDPPCQVPFVRQVDAEVRLLYLFFDGSIRSSGSGGEWSVEARSPSL